MRREEDLQTKNNIVLLDAASRTQSDQQHERKLEGFVFKITPAKHAVFSHLRLPLHRAHVFYYQKLERPHHS